jgi:hypothetical protein
VKWKKNDRAAVSQAVRPPVDSTGNVEFMGAWIHDRHRCYIMPAG